ncbi:hypothetical protein L1987_74167 [Smallanthus sonchifolius]|uniref:Uncharacterized protein n=1 Tax=Smallanthus sonchifolius TaxID=185202 RepID=A0ACB9A1G5_9ASTR|nr:hypothetical protein L1987_74167 [Smallanthus sonchifolius]
MTEILIVDADLHHRGTLICFISHRQNMVDENIQIEMQDEGADASISFEKTESLSVYECLEPDFTCFNGMMDSTSLLLNYMLELDRLCCPVSLGCYRRKKTSSLEITVFLYSASLQDIISRFKERKMEHVFVSGQSFQPRWQCN